MLEHTPSLRELSEKKCLPWRCSRVALIKYGAIRRSSTIPIWCGFSTASLLQPSSMRLFECRGQNVLPWHLRVLLLVVGHTGFSLKLRGCSTKRHRRSSRILHCSYNPFISPPISSVTFLVSTQSLPKLTQKGSRFKYSSPCVPCGHWPTLLCWSFNLMLGDLLM